VQLGLRSGGTTFRHNIVIGGGAMLLIAFLSPKDGLPLDPTKPLTIENNLFLSSQTPQAAYLESRGDTVTPVLVRDNLVGRLGGSYAVVYPGRTTPAAIVWAAYNGVVAHMAAQDNVYDSSVMAPFLKQQGTAQLTATNNRLGTVPLPRFRNFMELAPGANYLGIEKWNRAIGEAPDFPAEGTTKGTPIVYGAGSLVMHNGRLYRSRQANNHNHQPQGATDSWWELVRFTSTGGSCVPDDLRLFANDFYALRGIGLTRTVTQRERFYLPLTRR
ncbi:MAG TPA: hypothetical protein VGE07_11510, partial [Herpetosiphonaceae bacterium]